MTFRSLTHRKRCESAVRRMCEDASPRTGRGRPRSGLPWDGFKACVEMGAHRSRAPRGLRRRGSRPRDTGHGRRAVAGYRCIDLSVVISKLGMPPIMNWGTKDQKSRYIPRGGIRRVAGGATACRSPMRAATLQQCVVAPCETATTTCLSGTKYWITNAGVSDIYTVSPRPAPTPAAAVVVFHRRGRLGVKVAKLRRRWDAGQP